MTRLIDADALAEGYKHMGYNPAEHPEESYMEGWCKGFNAAVDHCMHHVIHAPTIESRKKGTWKKTPCKWVTYECSECGEKTDETIMGLPRYVYCPMCGARMVEYETD